MMQTLKITKSKHIAVVIFHLIFRILSSIAAELHLPTTSKKLEILVWLLLTLILENSCHTKLTMDAGVEFCNFGSTNEFVETFGNVVEHTQKVRYLI